MKSVKIFSLTVAAAMALMALAVSSASATALYNGSTILGTGAVLDFSIPSGSSMRLADTVGNTLDTCTTSTIKGKLTSAVTESVEETTWGSCTFPTKTTLPGKLEYIWAEGTNGVVKVDTEFKVSINTVLFGECVYGDNVGSFIGSIIKSAATQLLVNWVVKKLSPSNPPCPETAKWIGTYVSTEPASLRIEKE
jgi:hypothetical protein